MRSKMWLLRVALVLVARPLGVLAVASTRRHVPLPVTAAMRRHYLETGKRRCEAAIKKAEVKAPSEQLVAVRVAIDTTP